MNTFAPIFYLHPQETFYPCSMDWLIEHSTLVEKPNETGPEKIIGTIPLTNQQLFDVSIGRDKGITSMWFEYPEICCSGQDLDSVPIYGHKVDENETYQRISYGIIYGYNGPKKVLGCIPVGAHYGDVEHVTVEINKITHTINRVFFAAHTSTEGRWVDAKDLEIDELTGRPVVYIAVNSHACYPRAGRVIRFCGFGNDNTAKGPCWKPSVVEGFGPKDEGFDPVKHGWVTFCGRIGFDGVTSLEAKDWFYGKDPEPSQCKPPIII